MTATVGALAPISRAACVGGGVIGGGWIARFLLAGIDVKVFDPHPAAQRIVAEVLANAERAYGMLTGAPLPKRGRLTFCASVAEAVADAQWVQESVPERLDLKRRVLAEIDAGAPAEALIGSSTSGLKPSDLQAGLAHPGRLFVAHPYNPVYLLPLVEIVGGAATTPETIARAKAVLDAIGMKGVVIAREIEAFVGDRLLEALWREALWLIKDDICDVETLDDVIRYSFGLRWAQMGLFQTYRIAGGEAGMRHFLAQFGPCLQWPWTRLTDVVDLDDALVEKIGGQSDAQAAGLSIRELERIRDENLVGIVQALKAGQGGEGWGAGRLLKEFEQRLWAQAGGGAPAPDPTAPLELLEIRVSPAWIDYNGHMTEHRYLQVFGDTSDALLRLIGVDFAYVEAGHSYYTVETHLRHLGEARLGEALTCTTQVLAVDDKRLHLFHRLFAGPERREIATAEYMMLHVDSRAGRSAPAPEHVLAKLRAIADAHAKLETPAAVGRAIGQKTRLAAPV
ncbi:carnitine 3-dehydrogenase [Ancylobacter dichloromethanicus]|uniref:L-carnitine dehydrogenase n=1 Tax=Ancylobacter dichloromethanicus TaxID=518825 RepID=A0A9W6MXG0_9HYPH|nr:carnitine 3-dehydrogenase [Ancylobacter dichloromethanicus]MBS7556272.1 carnitine 3-dehydrogenase [Ancylobacter dichloromethanicus]GLK70033.1 L-carnitine dehydrogenase [Ancylobacter dichloromethanicus]